MHTTLFANVLPKDNPYVGLLQQAVQLHCDGPVAVYRRFTPGWVLKNGKAGGIAHIQWIESHLRPQPWFGADATGWRYLIDKLGNNRISYPVRAAGLLAKLALALVLARRAGVRVVYTVHNLMPYESINAYHAYLAHLANRLVFALADAVHVHNHYTLEAVAHLYGRTRNVFLVPIGNFIPWYPNTVSRAEARLRHGLSRDTFVYLFVGQIAPYKGLENLVDAFVKLDDASTRLIIAGRVAQADYGARIAAMAQHPGVIYRPGFVPDEEMQVYLNAADVMVLPFRQITSSSSVLLAFSFGCPVVAPAIAALSDVVPSSAGVLYPPEEPGALTDALRRARGIAWSSQAILAYARKFDWEIIGPQIVHVYQTALCTTKTAIPNQEAHT